MSAVVHYYTLPDTSYDLWVRGELAEHLHLPDDGTRVEIVGGEIVVSPGPAVGHNGIVQDIERALFAAELADPAFLWGCVQTTNLNLVEIGDGYIPDLIVLDTGALAKAREVDAGFLLPADVGLVVEVTSPSNAANDRMPTLRRPGTKCSGYARAGIEHYLLVDRDPGAAQAQLFTRPDPGTGLYRHTAAWDFGETIRLPEPFGVDIPTGSWHPWAG